MADRILSCFIDEAGDFGEFESHSPYYIVAVVTHKQSNSIQMDIEGLENYLSSLGFPHHALHTGPLIRRESVYEGMEMEQRQKLFNLLFRFTRKVPIRFFTAKVRNLNAKIQISWKPESQKKSKQKLRKTAVTGIPSTKSSYTMTMGKNL